MQKNWLLQNNNKMWDLKIIYQKITICIKK